MSNLGKKYNCDIVQDLLPLYQDDICSDASKAMIEEHLEECSVCRDMLDQLKNTKLDDCLLFEKNGVLEKHLQQEKKRAFMIGLGSSVALTISILSAVFVIVQLVMH